MIRLYLLICDILLISAIWFIRKSHFKCSTIK